MFKLSKLSRYNREGVDDCLIQISDLAIAITLVDFGVPRDAGLRTAETQNRLFRSGSSLADGYEIKSFHQSGYALDFYAYVNGKASFEEPHLAMVAAAFLQAAAQLKEPLRWGGLWRPRTRRTIGNIQYGWDMCHVELIKDRRHGNDDS